MSWDRIEFTNTARVFIWRELPFLEHEWRRSAAERLAKILEQLVKEHTSTTANAALREAARQAIGLAQAAKRRLPAVASRCRCDELNDGEHRPQPLCHMCCLAAIETHARRALETP